MRISVAMAGSAAIGIAMPAARAAILRLSSFMVSSLVVFWSVAPHVGPAGFDALGVEPGLEVGEHGVVGLHLVRRDAVVEAVAGQQAGDLADVPLHRVQPVAAIGDVSGADGL